MRCAYTRYPGILASLAAFPAAVSAHPAAHDEMGLLDAVAHMLGQHYGLALILLPFAALALWRRSRTGHRADGTSAAPGRRGERPR